MPPGEPSSLSRPGPSGSLGPPGPHKGVWDAQNTQSLMPPPPVPLKALLPAANMSTTSHTSIRSSSVDSHKWVPSSQTQELSIPRHDESQPRVSFDTTSRVGRHSQVVPSSQEEEREMCLSPRARHVRPLSPARSNVPPLLRTEDGSHANEGGAEGMPSPEVIESSQSQFETEITAAMVEALASRAATLQRYVSSCVSLLQSFDLFPGLCLWR